MTKKQLIENILDASKIHHNISVLGMNLPDAPDDAPYEIFLDACQILLDDFQENWEYEKRNDKGNRNLCGCNVKCPENITTNGACKEHDFWHVYTYGRSGATLYWDKYWEESNAGFWFKYTQDDLKEMTMGELREMYSDITAFNDAVNEMMGCLPDTLTSWYQEWEKNDKEEKRRDAMGYNKTLGKLLEDNNPQIVRLAKGIKKELNK